MTAPFALDERHAGLRDAFDQAFAVAPGTAVDAIEDLLAVRVGGDPYALRVRDISGLVTSRKIVALPSRRPELLGVAGHRGSLVPVYGLAALLGYDRSGKPPPWLALVGRGADPIAVAFEEFEGFLRVGAGDVRAAGAGEHRSPHSGEVVHVGGQLRRIVNLSSALDALAVHAGAAGSLRES